LFDLHPAKHLADDRLDVLVRDGHALETVDLLDFVDEVHLQLALAEHLEDVVRVTRAVDESVTGAETFAFLHVDVDTARNAVLLFLPVVGRDVDLALSLGDVAEADRAVDLGDDGRIAGLAGLEELDDSRQTAGDVLGAGGLTRDLGENIAGVNLVTVLHHEVGAGWHEVALVGRRRDLGRLDDDGRLTLLVGGLGDDETGEAGDLVDLFVDRDAFLQVLELHGAGDLGEDGEGVGVPLAEQAAELDLRSILNAKLGAVDEGVALLLATLLVDDGERAGAIHDHQATFLGADGDEIDEVRLAGVLGLEVRGVCNARSGAADVEGTHGELRAGLADGLRRDDADGLAHLHHLAGAEVAAVAEDAAAALGLAGEDRANLDALDARGLNSGGLVFVDLFVDIDDDLAFEVLELLERDAADDAVAQRLDGLACLDDRGDVDAFDGAAVVLGDDHVLGDVDESPGEVAGISGLERRVSQTLAGAVGRDEVLEHGETLAEVGLDGRLDDFAGRLGHKAAHSGQLTDLLLGTAGAGVGHDVDRVHGSFLVRRLDVVEHLVGDAVGDTRPQLRDLVLALLVGDGAFQVLLLQRDDLLFSVGHNGVLRLRDDHVVEADRQAGAGGVLEAELLDAVERANGDLEAEVQVAVVDELADALLLEQTVDERNPLRQRVIEDGAADRGGDVLLVEVHGLGVRDVLVVVGRGHVEHGAGVAQADRRERFHLLRFQRHEDLFDVGEGTAFTDGADLGLGQVVEAEHHVLRGHGDGLAGGRRQDVVRGEHEDRSLDLRLRRERDVHGHLVAVEVRVEGGADERMNLDGLALDEHRLEGLDAEAVQRRSAVQQHGVV